MLFSEVKHDEGDPDDNGYIVLEDLFLVRHFRRSEISVVVINLWY
jgi:hypothetical protein